MKILAIVLLAVCLVSALAALAVQSREGQGAEATWDGPIVNSKKTVLPTALYVTSAAAGFLSGLIGVVTAK